MQPGYWKNEISKKNSLLVQALITGLLVLSVLIAILAPVGAYFWRVQPFSGFLLEPTLVITDIKTETEQAGRAGIAPAMRILRIAGVEIRSTMDYNQVLRGLSPGDVITVTTQTREGIVRLHPELRVSRFPTIDFLKLFWLPYVIGLVYLVCGIWIYRIKIRSAASDALAFFFFIVAIICLLLFDLYTTHTASIIWVAAMSLLGTALFLLVIDFPQGTRWVSQSHNFRYLILALSLILFVWGIWAVNFSTDPWAYFNHWFATFRFAGLGILLLLAKIIWIAFKGENSRIRTQSRIILLGAFLGFLPLNFFFLAPLMGIQVHFNALILMPSLIIFPISILFAISRFRLLSSENLVNRAVTFSVITTILAGLFPAAIKFFQDIFFSITGQKNETSVFVTTFVLVALVEPVKKGVQNFVNGKSRERSLDDLAAYRNKGFPINAVFDVERTCKDLLTHSASALNVKNAAIAIMKGAQSEKIISIGRWPAEVGYYLPIISHTDQHLGHLFIGLTDGKVYLTQQKLDIINELARSLGDIFYLNSKIQEN